MDRALHAVHVEAEAEPAGQAGAVPGVRGAASVHAEEDALGACVGVLAPARLEAVGEQSKVKACGKPVAQILVHAEEAAPCRPAAAGFCPVACGKTGLAGFPAPRRRSLGQALEHARKEALAEQLLMPEGIGEALVEGIGGQLGERPVNALP